MDSKTILGFDYERPFGVKMEVNAFDGKDKLTSGWSDLPPLGIHDVTQVVCKELKVYVEIRPWGPTHWGRFGGIWVVKPDGSCGMEVCSPVTKGWVGLRDICHVADALRGHEKIKADKRCSLHIHANVVDCSLQEVANI